jgi:predicted AAA+ superfamily ATPase
MMGLYAENLVAHEVCRWAEAIEVTFYREKKSEVDFVITHGGSRYLPIEVKYRKGTDTALGLKHFMKKYNVDFGVVIIRERMCRFDNGILYLPLRYFLLSN